MVVTVAVPEPMRRLTNSGSATAAVDAPQRDFFLLDPMLATGGSAVEACTTLKQAGVRSIRMLCIVAAPPGIEKMLAAHPDVPVYTAALDRALNAKGYILPGLGDAGDRIFGTR